MRTINHKKSDECTKFKKVIRKLILELIKLKR
jgi:hypothetical protein